MSVSPLVESTERPRANPYAPPATELLSPPTSPRVQLRATAPPWLRRLAILQLVMVAVGLALEAADVETIVATGPLYALLGAAVTIFAVRGRSSLGIAAGLSALLLTFSLTVLINVLEWSPSEADWPVSLILWSYTAIAAPLLLWIVLVRTREESHPEPRIRR